MTLLTIPVSCGEWLDKATILEIKVRRLPTPAARSNAAHELKLLLQSAYLPSDLSELRFALLAVNTRLWRIEDRIREKEADGDFGDDFIALARAVYHENDERGRIKQAVDRRMGSVLTEEKHYARY